MENHLATRLIFIASQSKDLVISSSTKSIYLKANATLRQRLIATKSTGLCLLEMSCTATAKKEIKIIG